MRGADCHVSQDPCVGRKGECQFVHAHPGGDGDRRHLRDVHRPLANDVAAQYFRSLPVCNQFAEAKRTPVNDGARGRVEMYNRGHDIMRRARLCFADAGLSILRLGEAAGCRHLVAKRHCWAQHGVGSRYKTRLKSLWEAAPPREPAYMPTAAPAGPPSNPIRVPVAPPSNVPTGPMLADCRAATVPFASFAITESE